MENPFTENVKDQNGGSDDRPKPIVVKSWLLHQRKSK
jgi:hypothetical protein